jgi:hypothetical protein
MMTETVVKTEPSVKVNRTDFFSITRQHFGRFRQSQVDGFEVLLAAAEARCTNIPEVAYIMATAWHETAFTMQPVRETLASSDEDAVARLEFSWKRGRLSRVKNPYWRFDDEGKAWFGRGYVQITHKSNYEKLSEFLEVDLVASPKLAMKPDVAAVIIIVGCQNGLFTGKRLSEFVNESKRDYVGARSVINGNDKAHRIADYAVKFEEALK